MNGAKPPFPIRLPEVDSDFTFTEPVSLKTHNIKRVWKVRFMPQYIRHPPFSSHGQGCYILQLWQLLR